MEDEYLLQFYEKEDSDSDDSEEEDSSHRAPPGWELERSTKVIGKYFYFNRESRLKYWQDVSLIFGWAVEYSDVGHKTYVNMITGERTLKKPVRKNHVSPDVGKRRARSGGSSTGGSSSGGGGSSSSHGNRAGGGSTTTTGHGSSSDSHNGGNVWKLVFSEKFKQRYYFNMKTKKQVRSIYSVHCLQITVYCIVYTVATVAVLVCYFMIQNSFCIVYSNIFQYHLFIFIVDFTFYRSIFLYCKLKNLTSSFTVLAGRRHTGRLGI